VRTNPFIRFNRAAEAGGFPSLLIVSIACLALVVAPILLLALIPAPVVFAFALLGLIGGVAIVSAAIFAAFDDDGDARPRRPVA
jgi:hypothetical protein